MSTKNTQDQPAGRVIRWTEGNWVAEGPDMFGDYTICPVDDLAVAAVISNLRPPEIVAGNANLIVAAQDLYEALDALRAEFIRTVVIGAAIMEDLGRSTDHPRNTWQPLLERCGVDAALAKARGEA